MKVELEVKKFFERINSPFPDLYEEEEDDEESLTIDEDLLINCPPPKRKEEKKVEKLEQTVQNLRDELNHKPQE